MTMLITLHRNGRIQDPEQLWDSWRYSNTKLDSVQELNNLPPDKTRLTR
jgi:hypothetical protein